MTKRITTVPDVEWLLGATTARRAYKSPRKGRNLSLRYHAARLAAIQAIVTREAIEKRERDLLLRLMKHQQYTATARMFR